MYQIKNIYFYAYDIEFVFGFYIFSLFSINLLEMDMKIIN